MGDAQVICPRCGYANASGALYCQRCGEAIDPGVVAELRWRYEALRGAVLAVTSGVPVAVVIGAVALLLLGATWLSLRRWHEPDVTL